MSQNMVAGRNIYLPRGSGNYNGLCPMWGWGVATALVTQGVGTSGILSNWHISLSAAPGAGKSYRFLIRVNGVGSTLDITISGTATEGADDVNQVYIQPNDYIYVLCLPSGTPDLALGKWHLSFTPDIDGEFILMGDLVTSTSATQYANLSCSGCNVSTTETSLYQLIPVAGKLKKLYIRGNASPGGGTKTYRFTLRVNGVSTALTCDMVGAATTAEDVTHEVTVSPGDTVNLMIEPLNSPTNAPTIWLGVVFVPDDGKTGIIIGGTTTSPGTSAAATNQLCTGAYITTWHTAGTILEQVSGQTTLSKLYVKLGTAPGAGKQWVAAIYVNGVQSDLKCTISGTATTGNNTSAQVAINDGDSVEFGMAPTGTPASTVVYWGVGNMAEAVAVACYGLHQGAMVAMLS